MKNFIYILLVSTMIISSCKKDSALISDANYSLVKVFDDTTHCDALSPTRRIVAGNNRFFMCYDKSGVMGAYYDTTRCKILVTDGSGKFISDDTITGLTTYDLCVLNDGSFVAAAFDAHQSGNPEFYLYHYSENGKRLSVQPVLTSNNLPDGFYYYDTKGIQMSLSLSGKILSNLNYTDLSSNLRSFVFEFDMNSGITWSSSFYSSTTRCVTTDDGGYLLCSYSYLSPLVNVIKINEVGDSLWAKTYKMGEVSAYCPGIIRATDGNYIFADNDYNNPPNAILSVYEVNAQGDSLRSYVLKDNKDHYACDLVATDDGGVFFTTNNSWYGVTWYNGSFKQVNSTYNFLDGNLNVNRQGLFQNFSTDIYTTACSTNDGKVACFGIRHCYNENFYKPILTIFY